MNFPKVPTAGFPPVWANGKMRLVTTAKCNIACFYCHNEGQPKSSSFMGEDLFEHVLELIRVAPDSPPHVTMTGGEALLHPRLEWQIERLRALTDEVSVVTNGLLLTPKKIGSLKSAGITKIRLGVDSLTGEKSRPTPVYRGERPIRETAELILRSGLQTELNVVATEFNRGELGGIISFCRDKKISAKIFEHVQVFSLGGPGGFGNFVSAPILPFEVVERAILGAMGPCQKSLVDGFGNTNYLYQGDGFSVRYCKYLCTDGLCPMTGTRIDPQGFVYSCMSKRAKSRIAPENAVEESLDIIRRVVSEGCAVEPLAANRR